MTDDLREMLSRHEGRRRLVYQDSVGIPTIGVGRNIRDVGLHEDEIDLMLSNDIAEKREQCADAFPWFVTLDVVRQDVLVDMCFMGIGTLRGFVNMLDAMRQQDWNRAADEMMSSKWAKQVGARANELAAMIRSGMYLPT